MKSHITLGSTPVSEQCVQVGDPNYEELSVVECEIFKGQLGRQFSAKFGRNPLCTLRDKSFPHDFGSYLEVIAEYDVSDEQAVMDALWFEANLPEDWDELSIGIRLNSLPVVS